jgi:hypothetical protein
MWHRIQHWFGFHTGYVESRVWQPGVILVWHRCKICGQIGGLNTVFHDEYGGLKYPPPSKLYGSGGPIKRIGPVG